MYVCMYVCMYMGIYIYNGKKVVLHVTSTANLYGVRVCV